MPVYWYSCPGCKRNLARLLPEYKEMTCSCGTVMIRDRKGPSSAIKETFDNVVMPRAIERYAEIPSNQPYEGKDDPRDKRD